MSGDKSSRRIDPSIIAALIGVIGTIIVTLITVNAGKEPKPTQAPSVVVTSTFQPTEVIPTDTVPPGADTSTPAPTDTAVPATNTPIILAAGEDWKVGCISTVWQAYPGYPQPDSSNGCLVTPFNQFYTTGGNLAFIFNSSVGTAEVYGIFTQLPSSGSAELDITLDTISNGDILVGVFASPDINSSGGVVLFPATNTPRKDKILLKTMPGFIDFAQSSGPVDALTGYYNIKLSFDPGEVKVTAQSNQINLGSIPVVSANKWLFVGYRALIGGNQLKASFGNLTITP